MIGKDHSPESLRGVSADIVAGVERILGHYSLQQPQDWSTVPAYPFATDRAFPFVALSRGPADSPRVPGVLLRTTSAVTAHTVMDREGARLVADVPDEPPGMRLIMTSSLPGSVGAFLNNRPAPITVHESEVPLVDGEWRPVVNAPALESLVRANPGTYALRTWELGMAGGSTPGTTSQ